MAGNRKNFNQQGFSIVDRIKQNLFSRKPSGNSIQLQQLGSSTTVDPVILENLRTFLQAVLDDDQKTVLERLAENPELLIMTPPSDLVLESRYTWQKFYAESAIDIACKRNQIKMLALLLPFLERQNQVENADDAVIAKARAAALAQLATASTKDPTDCPQQIKEMLEALYAIIEKEEFTQGYQRFDRKTKLLDVTEQALHTFREHVLPAEAIKLDDAFDPEQMLYAAFSIYYANQKNIGMLMKDLWVRDVFAFKVIGFLQSLLPPEKAKILCEGLVHVVNANKAIERGETLTLLSSYFSTTAPTAYYRAERTAQTGLGFEFYCNWYGVGLKSSDKIGMSWADSLVFDTYLKQYPQAFASLREILQPKKATFKLT